MIQYPYSDQTYRGMRHDITTSTWLALRRVIGAIAGCDKHSGENVAQADLDGSEGVQE